MGLETFVFFYEGFKTGAKDKTISLLKQRGYTQNSAQVRWNAGRNIFKSNSQVQALEYISASPRMTMDIIAKAKELLLKEKALMP